MAARSAHSGGGVVVGMCDGSLPFLSQNIDLATFQSLGTRSGGEMISLEF